MVVGVCSRVSHWSVDSVYFAGREKAALKRRVWLSQLGLATLKMVMRSTVSVSVGCTYWTRADASGLVDLFIVVFVISSVQSLA